MLQRAEIHRLPATGVELAERPASRVGQPPGGLVGDEPVRLHALPVDAGRWPLEVAERCERLEDPVGRRLWHADLGREIRERAAVRMTRGGFEQSERL